jgi:2-C-methyl-D-erythritol 4-phosphate cytidylyltransferase
MLVHTVAALLNFAAFAQVLVVVSPNDALAHMVLADLLKQFPHRLRLSFTGGDTRAATVRQGLAYFQAAGYADNAWVWVHDAARPAIAIAQLHALKNALSHTTVGALLATPVADTLKRSDPNPTNPNQANNVDMPCVLATVSRQNMWQAQTPQCFGLAALSNALDAAAAAAHPVTDEASAIEFTGQQPVLVAGSPHNFKVTQALDAALMSAILMMNK